jgi:DNA-binding transcriptional regulator GbsR (MarR family)
MNTENNVQQFIEDMGAYMERNGLSRMAGRIIAWLLICDPPDQSMPEIVEALQASKSSISTALWQLEQVRIVNRRRIPGQRREYFRIDADMWNRAFEARFAEFAALRNLAERGLQLLENAHPQVRKRLELMRDMNNFIEREFPKLLEKWEEEKRAKGYE